jgi:predicted house-cleaning noncanonical NTP pyrophosphatase (MazG superfamily)
MKLVRDFIPHIIEENGKTCEYHVASYDEYKARLYEKMREELEEFINTPCIEEAADMYEVLRAICKLHGLEMVYVEVEAADKRLGRSGRPARGGFKDRIILEKVNGRL